MVGAFRCPSWSRDALGDGPPVGEAPAHVVARGAGERAVLREPGVEVELLPERDPLAALISLSFGTSAFQTTGSTPRGIFAGRRRGRASRARRSAPRPGMRAVRSLGELLCAARRRPGLGRASCASRRRPSLPRPSPRRRRPTSVPARMPRRRRRRRGGDGQPSRRCRLDSASAHARSSVCVPGRSSFTAPVPTRDRRRPRRTPRSHPRASPPWHVAHASPGRETVLRHQQVRERARGSIRRDRARGAGRSRKSTLPTRTGCRAVAPDRLGEQEERDGAAVRADSGRAPAGCVVERDARRARRARSRPSPGSPIVPANGRCRRAASRSPRRRRGSRARAGRAGIDVAVERGGRCDRGRRVGDERVGAHRIERRPRVVGRRVLRRAAPRVRRSREITPPTPAIATRRPRPRSPSRRTGVGPKSAKRTRDLEAGRRLVARDAARGARASDVVAGRPRAGTRRTRRGGARPRSRRRRRARRRRRRRAGAGARDTPPSHRLLRRSRSGGARYDSPRSVACRSRSARSSVRPRASRDITVPSGQCRTSAISR